MKIFPSNPAIGPLESAKISWKIRFLSLTFVKSSKQDKSFNDFFHLSLAEAYIVWKKSKLTGWFEARILSRIVWINYLRNKEINFVMWRPFWANINFWASHRESLRQPRRFSTCQGSKIRLFRQLWQNELPNPRKFAPPIFRQISGFSNLWIFNHSEVISSLLKFSDIIQKIFFFVKNIVKKIFNITHITGLKFDFLSIFCDPYSTGFSLLHFEWPLRALGKFLRLNL